MNETVMLLVKLSLVVFMAGNLLDMASDSILRMPSGDYGMAAS
jgi:hypothetical protein